MSFIYLIRLREFARLGENTFKIGKTRQDPEKRMRGYPKGSEIYLFLRVKDCNQAEKMIISKFKKSYQQRREYGTEYFSGNCESMLVTINDIIKNISSIKTHTKKQKEVSSILYLDRKHTNISYMCEYCKLYFNNNTLLQQHLDTDIKCIKQRKSLDYVVEHDTGFINMPYKCDYCRIDFDTNILLHAHINTSAKCIDSRKALDYIVIYEDYHKEYYEENKIKFICEGCNKTYTTKGNLKTHIKNCTYIQVKQEMIEKDKRLVSAQKIINKRDDYIASIHKQYMKEIAELQKKIWQLENSTKNRPTSINKINTYLLRVNNPISTESIDRCVGELTLKDLEGSASSMAAFIYSKIVCDTPIIMSDPARKKSKYVILEDGKYSVRDDPYLELFFEMFFNAILSRSLSLIDTETTRMQSIEDATYKKDILDERSIKLASIRAYIQLGANRVFTDEITKILSILSKQLSYPQIRQNRERFH